MFTLTACDEYGYNYETVRLQSRSEAESYLASLYDALDNAEGLTVHRIRDATEDLKEQLV